jgi:tetratricopeptide (TPR) repeat protein
LLAPFAAAWVALLAVPAYPEPATEYDERSEELKVELAKAPKDASVHFRFAEARAECGDWDGAAAALERVNALAPGRFRINLLYTMIHFGRGSFEEAVASANRALVDVPNDVRPLRIRARAFLAMGRTEAGLADYREVLATKTEVGADFFIEFATALAAANRQSEAISSVNEGIRRIGLEPALVTRAMELEWAAGRYADALRRLDELEQTAPRKEPIMAKRAAMLLAAGRTREAHAAWEQLYAQLHALSPLERGTPLNAELLKQATVALGKPLPQPVLASPTAH